MFNLYKITDADLEVLKEAGLLEDTEKCKVEKDVLKSGFECFKVGFEEKEDWAKAYKTLLEVTDEEIADVQSGKKSGGNGGSGKSGKGGRRRRK